MFRSFRASKILVSYPRGGGRPGILSYTPLGLVLFRSIKGSAAGSFSVEHDFIFYLTMTIIII